MREKKSPGKADYGIMAKEFLAGAGGCDNIISCCNCITRLRLEVKDPSAVDEEKMKASGAAAVFWPDTNLLHIVLGPQVFDVSREMKALMKTQKAAL